MFLRVVALLLYSRSLCVNGVCCLVPCCQLTRFFFCSCSHATHSANNNHNKIQWPTLIQSQARKTKDLKFGSSLSYTITHSKPSIGPSSIYSDLTINVFISKCWRSVFTVTSTIAQVRNSSAFTTRALQMLGIKIK